MQSEWYSKRDVAPAVLDRIGADRLIWEIIAQKVHREAIGDISYMLGLDRETVLSILFERCETPTGLVMGLN